MTGRSSATRPRRLPEGGTKECTLTLYKACKPCYSIRVNASLYSTARSDRSATIPHIIVSEPARARGQATGSVSSKGAAVEPHVFCERHHELSRKIQTSRCFPRCAGCQ